jgi:hypothetical protein
MTMFLRAVGLFGIALCQGNGSRGSIRASGESALESSCSIILLIFVESLVILHVYCLEWTRDLLVWGVVGVSCRSKRFL